MSKGKRNRERRRNERQLMIGLDLANGKDFTAIQEPPVTGAEVYCVELLTDALKDAGVERDGPEWKAYVEQAKTLLSNHRQEVRHMYRDKRQLLKEWFFAQMLTQDGTGVSG